MRVDLALSVHQRFILGAVPKLKLSARFSLM
jgi:hypothetical protein